MARPRAAGTRPQRRRDITVDVKRRQQTENEPRREGNDNRDGERRRVDRRLSDTRQIRRCQLEERLHSPVGEQQSA